LQSSSITKEGKAKGGIKVKVREWIKDLFIAFIVAMVVRTFFIQAFRIPSESMVPTLLAGDHLLVEKITYRFREPRRGEVIVFKFPLDKDKDYIKRVIGLPGDIVEIRNKVVYLNGKPLKEPYTIHIDPNVIPKELSPRDFFGPVKVPENSFFVMGDNRDNSFDSRFWGFVPKKDVIGKALIIYLSIDTKAKSPLGWVRWNRIGKVIH
jgi:signal peptidase I